MPVAVKEELDVAGCVTTFGGEANSTPKLADGEVVRRLRAAGAVIVGKTTMPEFGAYPYTESASRGSDPQPVGPDPQPGRLQRRDRSRRGLRAWCPSGSAATAAARSGSRLPAADCSGSSHNAAG